MKPVTHSSSILSVILLLTLSSVGKAQSADPYDFRSLIGQTVNIQLADASGLHQVEVTQVVSGVKKGTLRGLNYRLDKKSKPQTVLAPQIAEIEVSGEPLDLAFDPKTKTVAVDVEKRQARVDEVKRLKGKIAAGREVGWQTVSAADFMKATDEEKSVPKELVEKTLGVKLECVETERWLMFTDLPRDQVDKYIRILDDVYKELTRVLELPMDRPHFRSKLPVYMLSTVELLNHLEREVYKNNDGTDYQTWVHWYDDGRVVVNACQTAEAREVATSLTYYMTIAILYRYGSSLALPQWLEDGMAMQMSIRTTPGGSLYVESPRISMEAFREKKAFAKDFLTTKDLDDDSYGLAAAIVDRLDKRDPARFRELLVALKAGLTLDEALRLVYRCDAKTFLRGCAVELGVPDAKLDS